MPTAKKNTTPTTQKPSRRVKSPRSAPQSKPESKAPGVLDSIAEFLLSATKAKPIPRPQVLAKLVKRFPEREADALSTTLNCQLGKRIEQRGIKLHRTEDGYFATGKR